MRSQVIGAMLCMLATACGDDVRSSGATDGAAVDPEARDGATGTYPGCPVEEPFRSGEIPPPCAKSEIGKVCRYARECHISPKRIVTYYECKEILPERGWYEIGWKTCGEDDGGT